MAKAQDRIYHSDFWSLATYSDDTHEHRYKKEISDKETIIADYYAVIMKRENEINMLQQRLENLNKEYNGKLSGRKGVTLADVYKATGEINDG